MLATTRVAALVLLVVTGLMVALSLVGALPGWLFVCLMFSFNTSFLVVMANAASLVIDPHREIAGFASSAYGFFTQITASAAAILTVPLYDGALLPWALSMLGVTASGVCGADGLPAGAGGLAARAERPALMQLGRRARLHTAHLDVI